MIELHLLDAAGLELPAHTGELVFSPGEKALHAGFPAERRRREFLLGRLLLKAALTGFNPSRIKDFPTLATRPGANGKPTLTGVRFNLSHAGDVFLLAVGTEEVGVDVEPVQDFDDGTAALCFSPEQRAKIARSQHPERLATLLWCLREAEGKLWGTGLAGGVPRGNRARRRGGFFQAGPALHAWALASPPGEFPLPRWHHVRPGISALLRAC